MYSGFNDAAELRENNFKLRHKGSFSFFYMAAEVKTHAVATLE